MTLKIKSNALKCTLGSIWLRIARKKTFHTRLETNLQKFNTYKKYRLLNASGRVIARHIHIHTQTYKHADTKALELIPCSPLPYISGYSAYYILSSYNDHKCPVFVNVIYIRQLPQPLIMTYLIAPKNGPKLRRV